MRERIEPVSRHDDEENRWCELRNGCAYHVEFTQINAEDPFTEMHCVNQDWQADQEELVGERQIEDVQVGHRFHFAETQNHAGNGKRIEM